MPDVWTIDINNGAYVFDVPTKRTIRSRQEIGQDGSTTYREELLIVEGILRRLAGEDAEDLWDKFEELRTICFKTSPLVISLKLNGVTKKQFKPADGLGTPKCRELVQVPDEGDSSTHIRFSATFWQMTPTLGGANSEVTELTREITEVYANDGKLQEKIWSARATGKTLAKAKARVLSFKPKTKPLDERYTESPDTATFSATWTWRVGIQDSLVTYRESVSIVPWGSPVIVRPVVNGNPVGHEGRPRPAEILITTEIESTDETKIKEPSPHLAASADQARDRTRERGAQPPHLSNRTTGLWRAVFQEFYFRFIPDPIVLNHSDHKDPFKHAAIPNGPIGGSQGGLNK